MNWHVANFVLNVLTIVALVLVAVVLADVQRKERAAIQARLAGWQSILTKMEVESRKALTATRNLTAAVALLVTYIGDVPKSEIDAVLTEGFEDEDPEAPEQVVTRPRGTAAEDFTDPRGD